MQANLRRFLNFLFKFELLLIGCISHPAQSLRGEGPVSLEIFRPCVQQLRILSIVTVYAPVGKFTQTLIGSIDVVTIPARQSSLMRVRGLLDSLGPSLHGQPLQFVAAAALLGQRTISRLLLSVALMAGQRCVKAVQFERGVTVVREPQVLPAPSGLDVARAAGGTHLALVRVAMA